MYYNSFAEEFEKEAGVVNLIKRVLKKAPTRMDRIERAGGQMAALKKARATLKKVRATSRGSLPTKIRPSRQARWEANKIRHAQRQARLRKYRQSEGAAKARKYPGVIRSSAKKFNWKTPVAVGAGMLTAGAVGAGGTGLYYAAKRRR